MNIVNLVVAIVIFLVAILEIIDWYKTKRRFHLYCALADLVIAVTAITI